MGSYRGTLSEGDRILFAAVTVSVKEQTGREGYQITATVPFGRVSWLRRVNRLDLGGGRVGEIELHCIDSDAESGQSVGTFVTSSNLLVRTNGR